MNEPHCHETGRQIELLNEHSETLRISYLLQKDINESDRYPVVELLTEGTNAAFQTFRLCSRADCERVISAITEAMNSAFPL